MKIKFLGAAGTVTGSSYALTSGSGQSILIDLGMFQGPPEIDRLNYAHFDFDCSILAGAVLTHAHLDHCGRVPILLPNGFSGSIWMTSPTRDLTELSLLDSAKIAKQDEKQVLYDTELAEKTFTHFKTSDYRKPFQIGDFTISMRDAGHIMGSASLEIIDNNPESEIKKIVFSGDLGNSPEDLLEKTELFDNADAVVMESTYGDRLHPNEVAIDTLRYEIHSVEIGGGTLLIPAFSLERSQEILHMIGHLKQEGKVKPETVVYLDGPMAEKATKIYLNHADYFNDHVREDLKTGSPFEFPGLVTIEGHDQSQDIYKSDAPKVIIAGSGMMVGGRIVGHAAHYLPDSSTRLLIVGYQGEGTLGREIFEGSKLVTINELSVPVKATVSSTEAMSSHADQGQLLSWLKNIKGVKKVFLTHGEDVARDVLSKKIQNELGIVDVEKPTLNQEISF